MPGSILAIVGSTAKHFTPADEEKTKEYIRGFLSDNRPDVVVSGGADGVDTWAVQIAKELGIPTEEYPPSHFVWEPHGYKERNTLIAQRCTSLLRIAHRDSGTYGSGWTRDAVEGLGKRTVQHDIGSVLIGKEAD